LAAEWFNAGGMDRPAITQASQYASLELTRFRFRHKHQAYLSSLEARWAAAAPTPLLP